MPATYNVATDAGKVRLLISDVGGIDGKSFIFEDNEIDSYLTMRGGDIRLAAATALKTIAANEAQVSKRIKFLELSTDGPAVAKELLNAAEKLEKEANEDLDEDGGWEIAAMSNDPFGGAFGEET
jgi:hypothetical protein